MQHMKTMSGAANDAEYCKSVIALGWARVRDPSPFIGSPSNEMTGQNSSIQTTFLGCTQSLRIAEFKVTVDTSGHIMQSR